MGLFSFDIPEKEMPAASGSAVSAVIVAAGASTRMQGVSKQFLLLNGMPVLAHTLRAFEYTDCIREMIVVVRQEDIMRTGALVKDYGISKVRQIVKGGATRQESVMGALRYTSAQAEYLAIHDGARPLVTPVQITRAVEAAAEYGAAALAVEVKDTIKRTNRDGFIAETPDRASLRAVQTPQVFRRQDYLDAVERLGEAAQTYTDDCKLMEQSGAQVYLARGGYDNIKITTPEDLYFAQAILQYREETQE